MPKAPALRKSAVSRSNGPLARQMLEEEASDVGVLTAPGKRQKRKRHAEPDEHAPTLDAKTSRKVLAMARDQQDELDAEAEHLDEADNMLQELRGGAGSEDEGSEDEAAFSDENDYEEYEELEFDEDDDAMLSGYLPPGELQGGKTLADLIMEKIQAQESTETRPGKVGDLLSRYKSGPLPKAFKILPTLSMWPHLVMLTVPERWTPHATFAATRIFASNLDPKQSQKFYKEILLEKVREEIRETGKLSVHTYMALKKAIYKPAAFFKGLLFPLCESGTCTLREAAIIGSVLTKVSVPVLHSGAALLKLAEMEYTGPNSIFIRVLLDKKYALPYKVVDALVFHFIRFKRDARQMPVLWHQSFLVFVQRYKQDLTEEQKQALLDVLRSQVHAQITPEIRREIVNSVARGEEIGNEATGMEVEVL
ncbi:snoRNA-binding rRNA-processing protein [Microbotryomycetes sp. JL201]|nr:snoRNA-binding rRNA-processing protein [Microbotryomycetes sp. JL201]